MPHAKVAARASSVTRAMPISSPTAPTSCWTITLAAQNSTRQAISDRSRSSSRIPMATSLLSHWTPLAAAVSPSQSAADAAALAGAEKLQELYVQYTLPDQLYQSAILTTATTNVAGSPMDTAEKFASYNKAGNVSISVRDQDVTFGFVDANGAYHS